MKAMKNIRRLIGKGVNAVIVGVLMTALLAGCGNADKNAKETDGQTVNGKNQENIIQDEKKAENDKKEKVTVNIAYQGVSYAAMVDQEFGYGEEAFSDDNVELIYTRFLNGPAILEAVESGSVDIATGIGELPPLVSKGMGRDVVLVGGNQNAFTWDIFVPEDSTATSLEDLKGKKIAFGIGTQPHYALLSLAKKIGLTEDDFEIVNMNGTTTEYLAAIESGEIDAFSSTKPNVPDGSGVKVLVGAPANYDVTLVRGAFAKEHPEIVSKYLQVLQKGGIYLQENPQEAAEFISELTEQPVDTLADLFKVSDYTHFLDVFSKEKQEDITEQISFAYDHGLISEVFTLDEYYDPSYVLQAGEADPLD